MATLKTYEHDELLDKVYARLNRVERERDEETGIESAPLHRREGRNRIYNRRVVDPKKQHNAIPTYRNFEGRTLAYLMGLISQINVYGAKISQEDIDRYIKEIEDLFQYCRSERHAAKLFKAYVRTLADDLCERLESDKNAYKKAIKDFPEKHVTKPDTLNKEKLKKSFYQENPWVSLEVEPYELHTTFKIGTREYTIKTIPLLKRDALDKYLFGEDKKESPYKNETWYKVLSKSRQRFCDYYLEKMRDNPDLMLNSGLRGLMPGLKNAYRTELWCGGKSIYHSHHSAALPVANEDLFYNYPEKDMQAYMQVTVDQLRDNMLADSDGKKPKIIYTSLVSSLRDIPTRASAKAKRFFLNKSTSDDFIDRAIYYTANRFAEKEKKKARGNVTDVTFDHFNACTNGVRHLEPYRNFDAIITLYNQAKAYCDKSDNNASQELNAAVANLGKVLETAKRPKGLDKEVAAYDLMDAYNEVIRLFEGVEGITSCASGENRTLIEESEKLKRAICRSEGIDYYKDPRAEKVKAIARAIVNSGHFQQITAGPGGILCKWGIRFKSMDSTPESQQAQAQPNQSGSADTKRPYSSTKHQVTSWARLTGQVAHSTISYEEFKQANGYRVKVISGSKRFYPESAKPGIIYIDKNKDRAYVRFGSNVKGFIIDKKMCDYSEQTPSSCLIKMQVIALAGEQGCIPGYSNLDLPLLQNAQSIIDAIYDKKTKKFLIESNSSEYTGQFTNNVNRLIESLDSCEKKQIEKIELRSDLTVEEKKTYKDEIVQYYEQARIEVVVRFKYSLLFHAKEVGVPKKGLAGIIKVLDKKLRELEHSNLSDIDKDIMEICQDFVEGAYNDKTWDSKKKYDDFTREVFKQCNNVKLRSKVLSSEDPSKYIVCETTEEMFSKRVELIEKFESALVHCTHEQRVPKEDIEKVNSFLKRRRNEYTDFASNNDLQIQQRSRAARFKTTGHEGLDQALRLVCATLRNRGWADNPAEQNQRWEEFSGLVTVIFQASDERKQAVKQALTNEDLSTVNQVDADYREYDLKIIDSLRSILAADRISTDTNQKVDETTFKRADKLLKARRKSITDDALSMSSLLSTFSFLGAGGATGSDGGAEKGCPVFPSAA